MLQIRKIRGNDGNKYDAAFTPDILVSSVEEIFSPDSPILNKIPESERYNLYYTQGHAPEGKDLKKRQWHHQDIIPFDIDGITVVDSKVPAEYTTVLSKAIGVDLSNTGYIFTGNGVQIIIKVPYTIGTKSFFTENKKHYDAICDRIDQHLKDASLPGEADKVNFAPNRILRLPNTKNIKPNRPERIGYVLNSRIVALNYDLKKESGLPDIKDSDQITTKQLGHTKIDSYAVTEGCNFLKDLKANQATVSEPEWYAALSILGRLDDENILHEYSKEHPNYSVEGTIRKAEQATSSSGPRTCANIDTLYGNCKACPNFTKVVSPINLVSESFIATSTSGFHRCNKNGIPTIPQYMDLVKYFDEQNNFINIEEHETTYTYNGKYYEETSKAAITKFATDNFFPIADNKMRAEFLGLVKSTNSRPASWLYESTLDHLNFQNGILNLSTHQLLPHSPDYAFRGIIPCTFDPLANAPRYETLLQHLMADSADNVEVFLQFMGYAIMGGECVSDKTLFLIGEGGAGKSTIIEPFKELLGRTSKSKLYASIKMKQLEKDIHIAKLERSLVNFCDELPRTVPDNTWELIKDLVQGGEVEADQKYKAALNFENKCKLIFLGNQIPSGATNNEGLFRRMLIIKFDKSYTDSSKDTNVFLSKEIIDEELAGILNLALAAYKRLAANKMRFKPTKESIAAVNEHREKLSTVIQWVEHIQEIYGPLQDVRADLGVKWLADDGDADRCLITPWLRDEYKLWCEDEGIRYPVGSKIFYKEISKYLEGRGVVINKKRINKKVNGATHRALFFDL